MTILHPDRYSTSGVSSRKVGIVVHDSETPPSSFDSLARNMTLPGDRPIAGTTRKYGSGYAAIARPRSFIRLCDDTCGPYHAPPTNKTWDSICICGYSRYSRDEWLTDLGRDLIRGAALYIAESAQRHGYPIAYVDHHGLLAGDRGITQHLEVSAAWGQTDHGDLGANFPMDVLLAEVRSILDPPIVQPPQVVNPPTTPATPAEENVVSDLIQTYVDKPGAPYGVEADPAIFERTGHLVVWIDDGNDVPRLGGTVTVVSQTEFAEKYTLLGKLPNGGVMTTADKFRAVIA